MRRLLSSLGPVGLVVHWIVSILLFFAPFGVLGWPWWVCALVIAAMLNVPFVGVVIRVSVYVAAMFSVGDCSDRAAAVFWVSFAFFSIFELVPLALSLKSIGRR